MHKSRLMPGVRRALVVVGAVFGRAFNSAAQIENVGAYHCIAGAEDEQWDSVS